MKKVNFIFSFVVVMLLIGSSAFAQKNYNYRTFNNDPLGVREYTLDNGLKVYMSVYKDAPRIQTYIAVRAGSKNDPVLFIKYVCLLSIHLITPPLLPTPGAIRFKKSSIAICCNYHASHC